MVKKIFFCSIIFLPALLFGKNAYADNATTSTSTADIIATSTLTSLTSTSTASSTIGVGLQVAPIPAIVSQISQAKTLLNNITLNHALIPVYKRNTKKILYYELGDKDVALAILDPSTNNITTTVGRLNGTKMVFPDPSVNVQLTNFNGVNSQFQVNQPAGGTVIALKYLISETQSGSKSAIENGLSPVVYVPSSPALETPDVIAYGQEYIDGVIQKVAQDLAGLPSQAVAGETITQAIPPAVIKSLIYAEHTDSSEVLSGNAQGAFNNLNMVFALDQGDAFKYSVSSDGFASRGIAQFIQSTYEGLVKRHPDANLIPDYVTAMEDHENSIKAMYLLLDDDAGAVRAEAPQNFVAARAFEYGAASYNAGSSRVIKAVQQFGDNWDQDRSGQINDLQNQVNSLTAQVKSLKSKIKSAKTKSTKASFQAQLAAAEGNLSSTSNQLTTTQNATLRTTTVNYLTKIYKVIAYFNADSLLAMN